jgi:hypothetical protein
MVKTGFDVLELDHQNNIENSDAPPENIKAMTNAAMQFGYY